MEIREITDKIVWEQFLENVAPQSFFQAWTWGEVVRKAENQLWRFGLYDKNKLVAIAQVIKIVARRGVFLHVRHGPVFLNLQKESLEYFVTHLKKFGKSQGAIYIRISPLVQNIPHNKNLFKSFGFTDAPIHQMDGEYCWILDLDKDESELLLGMRKTTRYLIRQAEKLGVTIEKTTDPKYLNEFLSLYSNTAQRQQFVPHRGIREEFDQFRSENNIMLFRGMYQKKCLAAALILFYNNQAIYHHSASVQQKIPVNYLLQWEAIKEAKKRDKSIYNFWGIAPDTKRRHPWQGLSLFKKGFGGRLVEYLHAKDLPLSPLYFATYCYETLRKWKKGY